MSFDVKRFKDYVGEKMFERLSKNIGKITHCVEYRNYFTLGIFGENRGIIQYYKKRETFLKVFQIYSKIRQSPVVTLTLENPNSDGEYEKVNLYYINYLPKVIKFLDDMNSLVVEPYIDYNDASHSDLFDRGQITIIWKYLALQQAFKNINVSLPPLDNLGIGLMGYNFIYKGLADLQIVPDGKTVKLFNKISLKTTIRDDIYQNYIAKNKSFDYGGGGSANIQQFKQINQSLNVDYYLGLLADRVKIENFDANNLNINQLSNIVNENYSSYENMEAVSKLIILAINSIKIKDSPSSEMQNWLLNIKNIAEGIQGSVYFADIFSKAVPISFKLSKDEKIPNCILPTYADLVEEFFKSFSAINKLRKYVPTFMYTFGMFDCYAELDKNGRKRGGRLIDLKKSTLCLDKSPKKPFVLTESIIGNTIHDIMNNNYLSGETFLCVFQQILLSLEVAQREIKFAHYDLHGKNLILRPVPDGYTYTVLVNNKKITVRDPKVVPVFIDFGLSCCNVMGRNYGKYDYRDHEIFNFLVPCTDYIKIFLSCFFYAVDVGNVDLTNMLLKIGAKNVMKNDILETKEKISKCLIQKVIVHNFNINGKAASKTPFELLMNIQEEIGCAEILIEDRDEFSVTECKDVQQILTEIYPSYTKNRKFIENIKEENYIDFSSFIKTSYHLKNLKEYYKTENSVELYEYIQEVSSAIEENKDEMIRVDKEYFIYNFKRTLPDENEFLSRANYLESLNFMDLDPLNYYKIKEMQVMEYSFDTFVNVMETYYKARELNLSEFDNLFKEFLTTENYSYYLRNVSRYSKMKRWCDTLLNSLEFI
jgi:hypothetical protein